MTARETIAQAFSLGRPVYIAMSGGKDSVTVAHLCEPYIGKFKLLWANPGFNFSHVEDYIRTLANRYGMHEIKSDLKKQWEEKGIPSEVFPTLNWICGSTTHKPKLQPWVACCAALLVIPMRGFLIDLNEPVVLLHGQRKEDGVPNNGPDGWEVPDRVKILCPIIDWSTADVVNYLVENEVPLPGHYSEVHTSLDCWICPALFSHAHGHERMGYMKREHPEKLEAVLPYLKATMATSRNALERVDDMLRGFDGWNS